MPDPLIIERKLNAPADTIWNALTNRDQMKEWYFDIASFKPEPRFEFEFTGENEGRVYIHHCKILEVIPGRKLKHTWAYDGYEGLSYVTWELFPEGDQTSVKLTHAGLETFPQTADFKRENFQEGWTMILGQMLKNYVEKK